MRKRRESYLWDLKKFWPLLLLGVLLALRSG